MSFIEIIYIFLSVLGSCYLAGRPIVYLIRKKLSPQEQIITSFGFGISILATLALFFFLKGIKTFDLLNPPLVFFLTLLAPVVIIFDLKKTRDKFFILALTIFLLYSIKVFLIEAILPVFAGGMWVWDWQMHFNIAQEFWLAKGEITNNMLARTPLYHLTQAFFMHFYGGNFPVFQIVNTVLGSIYLLAHYSVIKKLSNNKIALLSMLFMFFSPWFIHNSWFTWPKMLTVYFLLLGLYFSLLENPILAGGFLAMGYLAHPLGLFFLIGIALADLWKKKMAHLAKKIITFLIIISPWQLLVLSQWSPKEIFLASPVVSHDIETSFISPGWKMVKSKLSNAIFSIVPFYLFSFTRDAMKSNWNDLGALIIKTSANIYYNPLMGALTLFGSWLTIKKIFKKGILIYPKWSDLESKRKYVLIISTALFCLTVLAHSGADRHGIFHNAMTPLGPLAAGGLFMFIKEKIQRKRIFIGLLIVSVLGIWLQVIATRFWKTYIFDMNWDIKSREEILFLKDVLKLSSTKLFILWGILELAAVKIWIKIIG